MAGDITYADVAMLPRERRDVPSWTPIPGPDHLIIHPLLDPLHLPPVPPEWDGPHLDTMFQVWLQQQHVEQHRSFLCSPNAAPLVACRSCDDDEGSPWAHSTWCPADRKSPVAVSLNLSSECPDRSPLYLHIHQAEASRNAITYAELRVKPKPKGSSRSETSASGCQHGCSAWFYVALVLGVLVLVLLGVTAVLTKQFLNGSARKSESLSQYGLNSTDNHISSEKTVLAVLLKWLMKELCEDGQATCELCPPGWQLHRGRCYYFSEEAVSWDDSQRNCLARKSQLLVIEDEIEMEFIDNKEKDTKYIWIGSKIQDIKKQRSSVEDPRVKENRIAINTIETDKSCAVYRRKNMIQADNCQTLKKWICKKNATLLVV